VRDAPSYSAAATAISHAMQLNHTSICGGSLTKYSVVHVVVSLSLLQVRDEPSFRAAAKATSHAMQLHYSHRTPLDRAVDEIELFMAHKNYGHNPTVVAAGAVAGAEAVAAVAAAGLLLLGVVRSLGRRSATVKRLHSSKVPVHAPVTGNSTYVPTACASAQSQPQQLQQQQQQQRCAVDAVRNTDSQADKLRVASYSGELRQRLTVQATC
jgi:hypothetical protein